MPNASAAWRLVSVATVLPLTAVLHHGLFYRRMCMLNPFGPDYHPDIVLNWLRGDPSPWVACALAIVIHGIGARSSAFRNAVLAAIIATIPITLWIWDIPFTGRVICAHFHDGRSMVSARHLYGFAALSVVPLWWWLRRRDMRRGASRLQ